MWKKRPQLRDQDGFLPWAKVIVRFKCLAAIERAGRERCVFSDEVLAMLADEAETMDADDVLAVRRALATCLKRFSGAQQELLLAPYGPGSRVKELAEQCGKSENAFYKQLGRLREKLAVCIRGQLQREAF